VGSVPFGAKVGGGIGTGSKPGKRLNRRSLILQVTRALTRVQRGKRRGKRQVNSHNEKEEGDKVLLGHFPLKRVRGRHRRAKRGLRHLG